MSNIILKSVATLLLAGFGSQAFAYSYKTCLGEPVKWNTSSKTLRASANSFPAGTWRDTLQSAVTRFNQNPSWFTYGLTTTSSVGRNNGNSEIWGTSDTGLLGGAPARAFQSWTCYWLLGNHVYMDEVDVVFDYRSPWQWASSELKGNLWNYGGGTSGRPMRTTALHEIGHGLILNHVSNRYNIMGQDYTHLHVNGNTASAYFGSDASNGVNFLYGTRLPFRRDLGVTHWRYDGVSGEYSTHRKSRLFGTNGVALPSYTDAGEARFRVNRGQRVRTEFNYESMGPLAESNVSVGYYISTNSTISTADTRIGGATFSFSPFAAGVVQIDVTIPSWLNANANYWLGVVIDETNAIPENVEWNNATYLPIRTN